jgi:hypothetical protein
MNMKRILPLLFLLLASPALAQTVTQSGTVTRNHIPYWVTSGVLGDAGGATDSPISGIGVTNEGGPGFCLSSQRATAAGRQQFCISTGTATGATVSLTNFGTAPSGSLSFIVNGITYPFPGSLSQVLIGTTPVVGGSNGSCLFVNGAVIGQQTCSLSSISQLTGDVTAVGPGVVPATLATVNGNVGAFGSGTVVPLITVNGKGLITAVSNVTIAIPGTQLTGTTLASNIVTSSLTTVSTIGTGVWQGTLIAPAFGGTGIANTGTITIAASLVTTGTTAPTLAFPSSGPLTYTFQASSDTIVGRATTDTLTNKTLTSPTINAGALSGTFSGTPAFSGANIFTLANQAQIAAATFVGNATASLANQAAFTIQGLTDITAPNTTLDLIPIYNHTTGTIQHVNASELTASVGSGVTSIDGTSGTFTTGNGVQSAGSVIALTSARRTLPTTQTFISGSSLTYTTPANVLWLEVYECGSGGGGGGNGTTGAGNGGGGNLTSFNAITAAGGGAGQAVGGTGTKAAGGAGGTGGTGIAIRRAVGQPGGWSTESISGTLDAVAGAGGSSGFHLGGGGNPSATTGGVGSANCGGGAGAQGGGTAVSAGGGGGGGEAAYLIINSPSATYTYTVGVAGTAGTAGTLGNAGGAGAAGFIQVIEHYGT